MNSLSWGPSTDPQMISSEHHSAHIQTDQSQFVLPPKRIVTGGSDNKVKLWIFKDNNFQWVKDIGMHDDWVRDVAWCNNIGLLNDTIASCSED